MRTHKRGRLKETRRKEERIRSIEMKTMIMIGKEEDTLTLANQNTTKIEIDPMELIVDLTAEGDGIKETMSIRRRIAILRVLQS